MSAWPYSLGFIGAGNMAEAICRSVVGCNVYAAAGVMAADPVEARREVFASSLGVTVTADSVEVARQCATIVLACKPQQMADVLAQIRGVVASEQLVISIAAGVSTTFLQNELGGSVPVIRVMPNTPLFVGQGMTAISAGVGVGDDQLRIADAIFGQAGRTVRVDERLMDAVTAVSGSGPAYFFYLIEAMVEAGVACGLSRETATLLAGQTCVGAGRMVLESEHEPAELRRRVTSPGGTTLAAITVMESAKTQAVLIDAVKAAAKRSSELGR
jgi:pyrroline-5-carboxylate reductase